MITLLVFMLFSGLFHTSESHAGEVRAVELRDGSIVTGEVLSLTNGKYTIRSGSLGTVQIEESNVRAIRPVAPATAVSPKAAPDPTAGDVRTLQDKMMSDKEIMAMIESLQNDPEFKKLLRRPGGHESGPGRRRGRAHGESAVHEAPEQSHSTGHPEEGQITDAAKSSPGAG